MKWKGRTTSGNVSDRRIGGSKTAIGGIGIAVLLIYTLVTGDLEDGDTFSATTLWIEVAIA